MISGRGNPHAALRPPLIRGDFSGRGISGGLSLALRATFRESTLIRLAFGQPPSPFKGEGFWAATRGRPYGQIETFRSGRVRAPAPTVANGPGALVRQSQARLWSRNSDNFCIPRAQWPGGSLDRHSDFARRKFYAKPQG